MGFPETERDRLIAASIERATQRERDLHQYPGDATAKQVAQAMWQAFLADPKMIEWSGRELKKRFPLVSHVTAHRIRMWIMEQPRPLAPPIISDAIATKIKKWRKKTSPTVEPSRAAEPPSTPPPYPPRTAEEVEETYQQWLRRQATE